MRQKWLQFSPLINLCIFLWVWLHNLDKQILAYSHQQLSHTATVSVSVDNSVGLILTWAPLLWSPPCCFLNLEIYRQISCHFWKILHNHYVHQRIRHRPCLEKRLASWFTVWPLRNPGIDLTMIDNFWEAPCSQQIRPGINLSSHVQLGST